MWFRNMDSMDLGMCQWKGDLGAFEVVNGM